MAKTFTSPFAQTVGNNTVILTAAVASLGTDAPTNTVLLLPASPEGAIITGIWALPRATVTATGLYLFSSTDGGTTKKLIDSALMAAYTYSTTTLIPTTSFTKWTEDYPLRVAANEQLYIGASVALASGISVRIETMDF